jgi:integrase
MLSGGPCSKIRVGQGVYFFRNRNGSEGLEIYAARQWCRLPRASLSRAQAERRRRIVAGESTVGASVVTDVPWLPYALAALERRAGQRRLFADERSAGRRGLTPNTVTKYRAALRLHELPHDVPGEELTWRDRSPLAELNLQQVTTEKLEATIEWMDAIGLKASTIRAYLQPIRATLDLARREGLIADSPFDSVDPDCVPSGNAKRRRALGPAEQRELLRCARCERDRELLLFALGTGLRISELIAVQWHEIDLVGRKVLVRRQLDDRGTRVHLKTRASRRDVFLSTVLVGMLQRRLATSAFTADNHFVFCRDDGSPLTDDYVRRRIFAPARDAAGLNAGIDKRDTERWVVFHSLRHTYASMLVSDPTLAIMHQVNQLGHEDAKTTMTTYQHFIDEQRSADMIRSAIDRHLVEVDRAS